MQYHDCLYWTYKSINIKNKQEEPHLASSCVMMHNDSLLLAIKSSSHSSHGTVSHGIQNTSFTRFNERDHFRYQIRPNCTVQHCQNEYI